MLDVHPWSDSTEFRGIGLGSSDCYVTNISTTLVDTRELQMVHLSLDRM